MIYLDMTTNEILFLALFVTGTVVLAACLWIISDYFLGEDEE